MKLYTSYFGNLKKLRDAGVIPIGISLYPPRWFKGLSIQQLAPHRYMLDDKLTEEEYTRLYKDRVLRQLLPTSILKQIETLSSGRDVALLCYEKPGDFCHRHIVADWLRIECGIEINEFTILAKEPTNSPDSSQQSLF